LYWSFKLTLQFLALLWGVMLLQFLLGLELGWLGNYPRREFGLKGILLSPLIHADFNHLISNSIPLLALCVIILFFYPRVALSSFAMIYLLTGLAVWLFGRPVFHIGASGVVYGLVAFVFWTGVFRHNLKSIVLALIVVFYYGSMFLGILPNQEGISWESHLLGALAGVFTAFWYRGQLETDEERKPYSWEQENGAESQEGYFLERDIFEKTKQQRRKDQPGGSGLWRSDRTWRED
jgi:membrane associated rhomboid family serine protease